jgi:hypothetical protein
LREGKGIEEVEDARRGCIALMALLRSQLSRKPLGRFGGSKD